MRSNSGSWIAAAAFLAAAPAGPGVAQPKMSDAANRSAAASPGAMNPSPGSPTERRVRTSIWLYSIVEELQELEASAAALAPLAVLYKPFNKGDLLDAIGRACR